MFASLAMRTDLDRCPEWASVQKQLETAIMFIRQARVFCTADRAKPRPLLVRPPARKRTKKDEKTRKFTEKTHL